MSDTHHLITEPLMYIRAPRGTYPDDSGVWIHLYDTGREPGPVAERTMPEDADG